MRKIKPIIFFLIGFLIIIAPMIVWAEQDPSFGLQSAGVTAGLTTNKLSASSGIAGILGKTVGVLLSMVGVFFFLLILIGGLTWMTAQGSAEKVDAAKKRMISAAIGLIIILSAYAITSYVFTEFLGGSEVVVEGNCKNRAGGSSCGDNMLCYEGECKEECLVDFKTGSCGNPNDCLKRDGYAVVPGKCPDGEDNMCCITMEEWDSVKLPDVSEAATEEIETCASKNGLCIKESADCPGQILSDASCTAGQKCCLNTCEQQSGKCVSKSSCTASGSGGKILSNVSCGASGENQVCCQTCTTLGGVCLYGGESCNNNTIAGVCPVGGDGKSGKCCIGSYN